VRWWVGTVRCCVFAEGADLISILVGWLHHMKTARSRIGHTPEQKWICINSFCIGPHSDWRLWRGYYCEGIILPIHILNHYVINVI
jgi:hypothetical protein